MSWKGITKSVTRVRFPRPHPPQPYPSASSLTPPPDASSVQAEVQSCTAPSDRTLHIPGLRAPFRLNERLDTNQLCVIGRHHKGSHIYRCRETL